MKAVECPGCGRRVVAENKRYDTHHAGANARYCFMSGMPLPVTGWGDAAFAERARIVACLATEVQDADPHAVWRYLSVMPDLFVRELLQLALAALDVEGKRVSDIWSKWSSE